MSTYGTMLSRIADDLDRTDLSTQIQTAVQNAVRYYERRKFWFNEGRATASTTASTDTYAVPTDYMSGLRMEITVNGSTYPLALRDINYLDSIGVTTNTGQPFDFAVLAEEFRLYPVPDQAYTLTLTYNRSLGELSASNDTNAWMVEAEDLIRFRAEWEIYQYILKNVDQAAYCKQGESDALTSLLDHTGRYVSTGNITPSYW